MAAGAGGLRNNPIQELFWTRTGLLLLVLVVVSGGSLVLSSAMDPGTGKNLLTALGTGTMISAIVGFGQTLITATASQRALVSPVIEESRKALEELSAEYRSLNKEFFPTDVFEATSEPNPVFNRLMMQDLLASRQFFFRGFSGRHAAARLLISHAEWELRTVIADPKDSTTISGRARYLMRNEGAEADSDAVQTRLLDEIRVGLVGLYLARSRCTRVDITVVTDPPLDRLEMFDESVWIHLFSDVGGSSTIYPRTLRFLEGSFIYDMERAEFLRVSRARTARHFQITPDITPQEFLALFHKITGTTLTMRRFRELEDRFHAFRQEFSAAAELES